MKKKFKELKVLFIGHKLYYADQSKLSYEFVHFYGAIKDIVGKAFYQDSITSQFTDIEFPYDTGGIGYLRAIRDSKPDIIFISFTDYEFGEYELNEMRKVCPVVGIFSDDHWRFDDYTSKFVKHLDLCITNDINSIVKYQRLGVEPHLWQWGYNENIFKRIPMERDIDLLFVGQEYADRKQYLEALRNKFDDRLVYYGNQSPLGTIGHEEINVLMNRAKIVLNFSKSSVGHTTQMKVRTFEAIGAGAFVLTEGTDYLDKWFEPNKEIGVFGIGSIEDCINRCEYWLNNEISRNSVAYNGWIRGKEYTYQKKFKQIIEYILGKD